MQHIADGYADIFTDEGFVAGTHISTDIGTDTIADAGADTFTGVCTDFIANGQARALPRRLATGRGIVTGLSRGLAHRC